MAGSHKPISVCLSLPQRAVAAVGPCASPALPKPPTWHSPHSLQHIHAVVMSQQQGTGVRPGLPPADDIGVILRPGGRFGEERSRLSHPGPAADSGASCQVTSAAGVGCWDKDVAQGTDRTAWHTGPAPRVG